MSSPQRLARLLLIALPTATFLTAGLYVFGGGYSETAQRWFIGTFGDAMEWRSRWIAGNGAINCGTVRIGGSADGATSCALQAFAEHRPFRVRYTIKTVDIGMAAGLVAAKNGSLYEMVFWGGGMRGTDVVRQRVFVNPCPTPISLRRTPNDRVTCFPPGPKAPQKWTSSWLSDAP